MTAFRAGDGPGVRLGLCPLLQLLLRLLRGRLREPHGGLDDAHVREAGRGGARPQRRHVGAPPGVVVVVVVQMSVTRQLQLPSAPPRTRGYTAKGRSGGQAGRSFLPRIVYLDACVFYLGRRLRSLEAGGLAGGRGRTLAPSVRLGVFFVAGRSTGKRRAQRQGESEGFS